METTDYYLQGGSMIAVDNAGRAAEMTRQNRIITELAPVLQGPIDPASIRASVPPPLQACWRRDATGSYFIVVNPSDADRPGMSLQFTGVPASATAEVYDEGRTVSVSGNAVADDFGPYAVHIYVVRDL